MQLEALARIAPVQDQLDPAELSSLGYIEARALANAERFEEALKAYERLAQANPDNADAQIGLAEQLLHAEDVSRLAQARNKWREIANRTRPGKILIGTGSLQIGG
jgi:cytochrome c-type biogenesis protein CcmH/NrfG